MKALTLQQPFASLVAIGSKKIETRSWSTKYRGPLAIHSSKGFKKVLRDLCLMEPFKTILGKFGISVDNLPLGKVIATCDLVDCIEMTPEFLRTVKSPELDFGFYEVGRWAWILDNMKPIEPIQAKGQLGLWEWRENNAPS